MTVRKIELEHKLFNSEVAYSLVKTYSLLIWTICNFRVEKMILILLFLASAAFYIYMKWIYSFWQRNQVLGPEPSFLVGNIGPQLNLSKHWGYIVADLYKWTKKICERTLRWIL